MQLMIAAAPELRQTACATRLPVANAAYRLEGGYLCALPMPRSLQGGALLLTGWDGVWRDTAAQGILRECRARQYGAVIVPLPASAQGPWALVTTPNLFFPGRRRYSYFSAWKGSMKSAKSRSPCSSFS